MFVLAGCGPDKISVSANSIDSIRIINVHDFSNYDRRLIAARDTITTVCRLFNEARLISIDTINPKLSYSLCDIYIYTRDEGRLHFDYRTTGVHGNLLWYSGSTFRSDSLIYWLR